MTGQRLPMPILLRAYRVMDKEPQVSKQRRRPGWVMVFDTETSTDYAQRLHFGGFLMATVRYNDDGTIRTRPVVEGLFADDELKLFYPEGFNVLSQYMVDGAGKNRLADVWPEPPSSDDMDHGELDLFDSSSELLYAMD